MKLANAANSKDIYLYRILSFDRIVKIFETGELHFSHPSKWEDPFEQAIKHEAMKVTYAQCWCSKGVSDAMWRIYSPDKIGGRIKIRKSSLQIALKTAAKQIGAGSKLRKVEYLPESAIKIKFRELLLASKNKASPTEALNALFYKRGAYSHEQEYRAAIFDVAGKNGSIKNGLKIEIDAHAAIDSILFDPRAPDEIYKAFKHYLQKVVKYKKRIDKSRLYKGVEKIEV